MKKLLSIALWLAMTALLCAQSDYLVKEGDTLWSIGMRHGLTVEQLRSLNRLSSDQIREGQKLLIRIEKPAPKQAATQPVTPRVETAPEDPQPPPTASAKPKARPQTPPASRWTAMRPDRFDASSTQGVKGVNSSDLGRRLHTEVLQISQRGVRYNQRWRPPGSQETIYMDCSNTVRYLFQKVANVDLERTASDQYIQLLGQRRLMRVPTNAGKPDRTFLSRNLQPGDLLFWEHTYRPNRNPPVTHVMVFLGTDSRGQWKMAGAQGPGVRVFDFDPQEPNGGYRAGFSRRVQGRFVAFGRPVGPAPRI